MAKIKFGMMMTDARGKLGGQVFSKNRSGSYVRTKVTPVNPRTQYQQNSRAILGNLSSSWSGLTNSERNAWNSAVEDWQKTDVFGDLRKPTGKNLYTSLNKELLQSGQATINMPPAKVVIPDVVIRVVLFDIDNQIFSIETLGVSTGMVLQVSATPKLTAGTSFIDDKLRVIEYKPGSVDADPEIHDTYINRFGAVTVGDNIWVQIKLIAPNGQASVPIRARAVISQ